MHSGMLVNIHHTCNGKGMYLCFKPLWPSVLVNIGWVNGFSPNRRKKLPPQMLAYCELNIYNSYNVQNKILKKFV